MSFSSPSWRGVVISACVVFPNHLTILVAICWTCSSLSLFFIYCTQTPDAVLQVLERDKGSLPWLSSCQSARMHLAIFAARVLCWLMFNLLSTRTPRSFSTELLPWQLPPACTVALGYSIPDAWLALVEEVPVSPFLQPVQIPLKSSSAFPAHWQFPPPNLVSPASLLEVYSIPLSRSLTRTSISIGLCTDLRKTTLATGSQLGFVPLIITSWAWQPSQYSTQFIVHFSSPICHQVGERDNGRLYQKPC